jgi:hypothetical protein
MSKDFLNYGIGGFQQQKIIKVDRKCINTLQLLYDNSHYIGGGVTACLNPQHWWQDFIEVFYDNVGYVMSETRIEMNKIAKSTNKGSYYEQQSIIYEAIEKDFETLEEMTNWFEVNKFNNVALYTVRKLIDLKAMKDWYTISYTFITDKQQSRNQKIEHIMEDDYLGDDDLPF